MSPEISCGDKHEFESTVDNRSDRLGRSVRERGAFKQYANVFRIVLSRWMPLYDQHQEEIRNVELEGLTLPSNEDWRERVYYRLVELQRECDAHPNKRKETKFSDETETRMSKNWEWIPRIGGYPLRAKQSLSDDSSLITLRDIGGSMTEACVEPGWRITDILLAAQVLQKIEPQPTFKNEAEMRRVFGLVYDVLRYKHVLNCALEDVGFWIRNRTMKPRERIVWLLLYDLQGRKFARRGEIAVVEERERMFKSAGLKDIEDALLEAQTHLAASVSRLRIGGSALNIDELLPARLRVIEGVTWSDVGSIASGWVNSTKINNRHEFLEEMSKLNFVPCKSDESTELAEQCYTFDPLCPRVVHFHDKVREKLAVSSLVQNHRFVFLERSLCLGAASLAQAIRVGRLCGPVILTHSVAPRHTGYLAGLLSEIEDAGRLLAFGAGERRYEYETYLKNLGVTLEQCRVYSEKYVSPPPSAELERATVVLAVPPTSYTGVKDIVDLAVARGGDIDLLESLTNASSTNNEIINEPRALLADQLTTLKYALTRPNVQFLIYEAHTILPAETTEMIQQVVDYANRMAMEKYLREHPPKRKTSPKAAEGKVSKSSKLGKTEQSQEEDDISLTTSADIPIPESDLFEVGSIEDIYGENSSRMIDPGCFLAVIRRKEMMQFNSLFMIKVAESKGLFGTPNQEEKPKHEAAPLSAVRRPSQTARKGAKRPKIEMERIMAPTYSSISRASACVEICPRHKQHDDREKRIRMLEVCEAKKHEVRRWWHDAKIRLFYPASSYKFRFARVDPRTNRILYPCHVQRLELRNKVYEKLNTQIDIGVDDIDVTNTSLRVNKKYPVAKLLKYQDLITEV